MTPRLRLGFACNWEPKQQSTWSFTPWNLRAALAREIELVDVGIEIPRAVRASLKLGYARRRSGRWVTNWQYSSLMDSLCRNVIQRNAARRHCDAVLEIQDLAAPSMPFFVLQDLTFDILLRLHDRLGGSVPHFPGLTRDGIRRRRDRQLVIYEKAAGVIVMSKWAASTLVEWSGVPASKVHVVYPGRTAVHSDIAPRVPHDPRRRLLLVGRDFHAKGGDIVVEALTVLRHSYDASTTLTVAGPSAWPLPGSIPKGVNFLGRVSPETVADLYRTHDLLVMPSRLEGFGIAFVEALALGLPCVGRQAFAMPEIITPGENGYLITGEDPTELAEVVASALKNDYLYQTCARQAADVLARFTWERSAQQVAGVVRATVH